MKFFILSITVSILVSSNSFSADLTKNCMNQLRAPKFNYNDEASLGEIKRITPDEVRAKIEN